ncbi:MAG: DUF4129 domain-containing protein [Chitinophagaceae bacterium]
MRYILAFLVTLFSITCCFSKQPYVLIDTSSELMIREMDVSEYKKQEAFDYDKVTIKPISLWDRFWQFIWEQIDELFSSKSGKKTINISIIIIALILIGIFIWKIRQIRSTSLFERNNSEQLAYTTQQENIHTIDFNEAIEQAIDQEAFRLAIRLLYLQTLKLLADKAYIQWQINKTNTAYVQEMRNHNLYHLFSALTKHFDFVWYGEANLTATAFQEIQTLFHQFQKQL